MMCCHKEGPEEYWCELEKGHTGPHDAPGFRQNSGLLCTPWPNADDAHDSVNHPKHYTSSPSGIECIQVVEHMPFCLGNAIKYLWRAGSKGDTVEDLRKSIWYIEREIARLQKDK